MRDHGSIGLFLGMGSFGGKFGFEFSGLFLFCFFSPIMENVSPLGVISSLNHYALSFLLQLDPFCKSPIGPDTFAAKNNPFFILLVFVLRKKKYLVVVLKPLGSVKVTCSCNVNRVSFNLNERT